MKMPLITAHAGSEHTEENSLDSLRTAFSLCPDAVEVDVRQGQDGTLVLCHNALAANAAYCTLADAMDFALTKPRIQLNCDLKESGLENSILKLARKKHVLDQIVLTGAVKAEKVVELERFVSVYLNIECLAQSFDGAGTCKGTEFSFQNAVFNPDYLNLLFQRAKFYHVRVLNLDYRFCSDALRKQASKNHMGLSLWTVDDSSVLETFLSASICNITTRSVKAALSIRKDIYQKTSENKGKYESL